MDKYYQYVGSEIRAARLSHNMKQWEVAQKLGITRQLYSQYERGACSITMKMWIKIADVLELDAYAVMDEAGKYGK